MDRFSIKQRTIRSEISFEGKGIHSGQYIMVRLKPAPVDSGIVFIRVDTQDRSAIPAGPGAIQRFPLGSCLMSPDKTCKVITIEHFMAVLSALGVTNLYVEMSGEEMPILDGSSEGYLKIITPEDVMDQSSEVDVAVLAQPLFVSSNDSYLIYEPADDLSIMYIVDYNDPVIGKQHYSYRHSYSSFCAELSRARTFCFFKDVEAMRSRGLALGGTLDNALVVYDDQYSSPLRYPQEPVRHKVLDLVGDLYQLGLPLAGHITAVKSSHALNGELVKAIHEKYIVV